MNEGKAFEELKAKDEKSAKIIEQTMRKRQRTAVSTYIQGTEGRTLLGYTNWNRV